MNKKLKNSAPKKPQVFVSLKYYLTIYHRSCVHMKTLHNKETPKGKENNENGISPSISKVNYSGAQ